LWRRQSMTNAKKVKCRLCFFETFSLSHLWVYFFGKFSKYLIEFHCLHIVFRVQYLKCVFCALYFVFSYMGNITWRTLRFVALLDRKYAFVSMFELFFNYFKNNLHRSKISLTFPKSRSEKSFFRNFFIGDRKIVTYVNEKQSIFLLSFSTSNVYPIIWPIIIKTTQNFRNWIF
jgi:hypothetical protein